ncbi:hypothetical protein [Chryseobacterium binzhouense]|uniref:hypothetical protein n=1 Tax=Chryseobacterium binzhouense TaxID=2593646 RepID=UPI00117D43D1|nr:hypothetical protein [Chryseobacterium binzhouense]
MKRIILYIAFSFTTIDAQEVKNYTPNIIPPAPSVNNLMKFEEVPVSHYTGVPDISIPIYSMATGLSNVSINLSLKYHSLNLKPEDRAGEAGIGWSLFAGGTISRTVIDLPDEIETISISGNSPKRKYGIYLDEMSENVLPANRNYTKKFIEAVLASPTSNYLPLDNDNYRKLLYEAMYQNRFDTSYDLYQYSFLNYSGRFIVVKNNGVLTPVLLDKNNLKITCAYSSDLINSFEITDESGNKFVFNMKEASHTSYFSYSQNILGGDNINSGYNSPYTSSYHLSSIRNSHDQLFVLLNYYPEKEISIASLSKINRDYEIPLTFNQDQLPSANSALPKIEESTSSKINTKTRSLKEIIVIDKGKIAFEYDYGRLDSNYEGSLIGNLPRLKEIKIFDSNSHLIESNIFFHGYNNGYNSSRLNLNSVKKYDKDGNMMSGYNLEYYPYKLEMTEDEWKYIKCNDAGYSYRDECVRAGQLKVMTLPTKGKIELDYEVNTYTHQPDSENFSPNTVEITNFDDNEFNWDPSSSHTNFTNFNSGYKYAFELTGTMKVSFALNLDDIMQGNYQWNLILYKREGNNYIPIRSVGPGFDSSGNSNVTYELDPAILDPGIYYFKLDKYSPGSVPNFSVWVNSFYKVRNMNNYKFLLGGGIRVKTIKYFEGDNNFFTSPSKMTEYKYESPQDSKKSSGALVFPKPMYSYEDLYTYKFFYYSIPDNPNYYTGNNVIRTTSKHNFLNVQKTKGGDIGYQFVVQSESGNGKTLYKFTSPIDYPNLSLPSFRSPFLPAENYDFRRGNILNKKVYKENDTNPINEEIFEYEETVVKSMPTGIGLRFTGTAYYDEFLYGSVFNTYEEYKNAHDSPSIIVNGQMMINQPYRPYCITQTKDSYSFIAYYLKNDIIGKTNLKKHEIINYFPNQTPLKTTKLYQYNSYDYPTMITETHPEGNTIITSNKYAHEKNNTRLINANMIGLPLEVTVTEKVTPLSAETLVSKSETRYDDASHLFPSSAISYNLHSGNASTQVTFDQYDLKGNILQYTAKDGVPTSIIWGYNGTQPIAKIEGALYNNIKNNPLIIAIINASNSDAANPATENNLITALDALRNDINFKNFQMATYTYDLLIGVTSITPPSGIREIYKYDTANRLEKIVDEEGKILKEYQYNYKP